MRSWSSSGRPGVLLPVWVRWRGVVIAQRVVLMGSRPGRIVREWEIDIRHPRTIESPAVSALAAEITTELHREISRHGH